MLRTPETKADLWYNLLSLTCVQALYDGGGIDEEEAAQGTADIWVEFTERTLGLFESKHRVNVAA